MGIAYEDVKYFRSIDVDFLDDTANGGDEGTQIVNDELHSIFPEISASQRESGDVLRAKIFVKNDSADRKMQSTIFYIKQDVQPDDKLTMYSASSNTSHEDDEDFTSLSKFVNSPIKTTVSSGVVDIDIPIADKDDYTIGDNVMIVDGYFRAVHRTTIADIQDNAGDPSSATITLTRAYASSVTIPSLTGYIANGEMITLDVAEKHPMWLELTVAATNAIDTEILNQFQIGVHFDDVAS